MPRAYAGQLMKTPRISSAAVIEPKKFTSHVNASVFAVWKKFSGDYNDVPARDDVLPKPVASFMRHISLLRWIPEYDDYEFRFIGDAHVQAYGLVYKPGNRLSKAGAAAPEFVEALKRSYDLARNRRAPVALRGLIGKTGSADPPSVWFEAAYLPLRDSSSSDDVDFVMNVAVYQPREGAWSD